MENLPNDILENILFRLPFTEALQATKVCKTWKTLLVDKFCNNVGLLVSYHLSGSNYVQLYHGEQYDHTQGDVDHPPSKMMNYYYGRFHQNSTMDDVVVGSCNGLVCLRRRDKRYETQYLICNPLTGEYVFVPQIDYALLRDSRDQDSWLRYRSTSDGFGYCHSTNEYKVVRIYSQSPNVLLVYTIGSNGWRKIGHAYDHSLSLSRGIFANGVLHWLVISEPESNKVLGFDLKDETSRLLPMPAPCNTYNFEKDQLKLLGGNLCFVCTNHDGCIEIWAFKRNNNQMEEHAQTHGYYDNSSWNWIKEFSIEPLNGHPFEPFAVTMRNQVLLWHRRNILYGYDPKASTVDKLWDNIVVNGMRCSWAEAIPHTNSFVSLKDLGERGAKRCK